MEKKVIGILGGMGPLATADLFEKIVLHTVAASDQEHPRVCIDSNTNIPDRTAALLHGGADPTEEMVKSARRLVSIGAQVIAMPCNTAHNFYGAVAASVDVPVLHMIALTRDALLREGVACAALLAGVVIYGSPYAPVIEPVAEIEAIWAIEDTRTESETPLVTALENHGARLGYIEFTVPVSLAREIMSECDSVEAEALDTDIDDMWARIIIKK